MILQANQSIKKMSKINECGILNFVFQDCIVFAEQLEKSTSLINKLLFSAQPAVILDALEFLTAAYQFGLKGALAGVQNMLLLVWSSEISVKNGVAAAYKQLYIDIASNAPGLVIYNTCLSLFYHWMASIYYAYASLVLGVPVLAKL